MRVLRVHAPGTPRGLAERVGRAVVEFNRGLDIRLRFLSIGIEETVIDVESSPAAATAVAASLAECVPDVVVVFGDGPAALAAAVCAARGGAIVVRAGAGRREGPAADEARAIDRLAALHLVHGAECAKVLDDEAVAGQRVDVGDADDPASGERIVRALSRARRAAQGGTTGGV
jgi:alkyl hydroperoxide reductase subunit AhpF